ncbi:hypothetical protein LPJ75_004464 [Coemansia sp. RSA 2598]|nr:hypothetical protein LPJ75_004464 [Coemansia sp. RSA 2598]
MTLGRKDAAIIIDGDHSVSRGHAVLLNEGSSENEEISITDSGSKFGVHINGSRIAHGATETARVGDTIHFGAQGTIFTVRSLRVSLYLTKMRPDSAQQTANAARDIGFDVVDSVTKSTHVVMPAVSATRTLLRALVLGRHIVGPEFVSTAAALGPVFRVPGATDEGVDRYVRNLEFLPPLSTPPMADDNPVCLDANTLRPHVGRRGLFASRIFLFADEAQHSHLRDLIADANGQSDVLVDADQVRALKPKFGFVCLVLPQDSGNKMETAAEKVRQIARLLQLRPISESEISLSILAASVAEHTSPTLREPEELPASASAETVPAARTRRRAAPRISNFWSSMVASSAGVSEPSQMSDAVSSADAVPETQGTDHPRESQLAQSPVHGPSAGRISVEESPAKADQKPSLTALAEADIDTGESGSQTASRICVIPAPLIKKKQLCQSPEASDAESMDPEPYSTVPNFKRFKKTVHIY